MAWGYPRSFPRAIVHVDGDAFFAACEVAKNPAFRGKPVITGKERGIVSSATYEAKALGIKRGVPLGDVRKICPEAIILPSDYETYSIFSRRMYAIVRRYTPAVEEYGIDECFADLTGLRRLHRMPYEEMAKRIKEDLQRELNITFSVGLGPTKTLAKLGSKFNKPNGLTIIPLSERDPFLAKTPISYVWGIGPNTAAYLNKFGIRTALDFTRKLEKWVREQRSKNLLEMWQELNGEVALELATENKETYQSIQKTKTFTPSSKDPAFVYSQLSKNVENACIKARRYDLVARHASFYLKTNGFEYRTAEIELPHASNMPQEFLREIEKQFPRIFRKGELYRTTGITLIGLRESTAVQFDLFSTPGATDKLKKVYEKADELSERYGKHAVFLASSIISMNEPMYEGDRAQRPERRHNLLKGETARKRLSIPFLGDVN